MLKLTKKKNKACLNSIIRYLYIKACEYLQKSLEAKLKLVEAFLI